MASDQGPVVQSAILRHELRRLRKANGLTQRDIAGRLEWSPSKVIRIEGGDSSITKVDLDALLTSYRVTSEEDRKALQALREPKDAGWWHVYRKRISDPYLNYVGYEAGAASIRHFPGTVVPGLLQTEGYARALTACTIEANRVPHVVELRLQRQTELAQRIQPPRQFYVLDEAVIRRHVGASTDPMIMPDQLHRIANEAAGNDLVTVRLIPFSTGEHAGLSGSFTVLGFDGALPNLLYRDTGKGDVATTTDDDQQVAEYLANFEGLLKGALSEDESVAFIRTAADDMSQRAKAV
jgi:transcriptional regulator with XRE-family HTH domain